ncbi:hypothetical protein LEL_10060 [Akanthomyces lecanii RCEF 1005]|uniref:Uncharacterized protein n=1 Tax=Akanthomyces lecanii RCEF 1005 TaxID=1081108 RepID=A0A162LDS8_CORDF|nr:hypothetical protein LEL_10060 [Akanthomyces lecanii RCEF 1005]
MLLRFSSTIIISITSFSPFSTNYRINDTKLRTTTIPNNMPGSLNSNDPDNMRNCLPHGESAIAALSVAFVFLLAGVGYLAYKSHHTKSTMGLVGCFEGAQRDLLG